MGLGVWLVRGPGGLSGLIPGPVPVKVGAKGNAMRSDTDKLLIETDGPVAIVTINRPHARNALDNETADALTRALRAFDAAPDLSVAVLTGAGGHFCAGADLKELAAGRDYKPWAGDPDGPCHDLLSKPVIAAVAGYACAGGLGVALRCDLRVAEEGATFAVLSRRWGVPMSDGTTVRLPRLIGAGRALDMLLTARKVSGAEAVAMGLADRLVPNGAARAEAVKLAHEIAAFPQIAMRSDRLSALRQWALPETEAIALEMDLAAEARRVEARAGATRFTAGAGRHGATGSG
jgi:enoyl-CoA hydratase